MKISPFCAQLGVARQRTISLLAGAVGRQLLATTWR